MLAVEFPPELEIGVYEVLRDDQHRLVRRVSVSRGNAEIRTRGPFGEMLRQAGKTEEHSYLVLHG